MWRLKENARGNTKQQNALLIKQRVESLKGKIDGLLKIEIGMDFSDTSSSADIALYSEFAGREQLDLYQKHPDHLAIVSLINETCEDRRIVDYEI
jgi:hypothetical protein